MITFAYFISSHGYGHAARSSAVMSALCQINPDIHFEIFSKVPSWFFRDSVKSFTHHNLLTDIGLVQKTSLTENIPKTVRRLNDFFPLDDDCVSQLARELKKLNCQLVLCDIAPLGIAVANMADIPSMLIENFTWDWIYEGYIGAYPHGYHIEHGDSHPDIGQVQGTVTTNSTDSKVLTDLKKHAHYLKSLFALADIHVQTEPVCYPQSVDLTVPPISRPSKTKSDEIRRQLHIDLTHKIVIITMGGIPWDYMFMEHLHTFEVNFPDVHFIIPGLSLKMRIEGNVIGLPHHSKFFHPDIINAADVVIGKVGYSTLAEVYQSGVPYGYIARPAFRESTVFVDYIKHNLHGQPIAEADFIDGQWLDDLPKLIELPRVSNGRINGVDKIAHFIFDVLHERQHVLHV
ncbi:MAG: hypothetical protein B6242_08140 [Anaerolineaceae bacterium 4572_78]|nr:MAG: hypothetical protein B6242_08140 [Anaerolineaceae bacterium 4572_78]